MYYRYDEANEGRSGRTLTTEIAVKIAFCCFNLSKFGKSVG